MGVKYRLISIPEVRTLATVLWRRTFWYASASVSEGNMSIHRGGWK